MTPADRRARLDARLEEILTARGRLSESEVRAMSFEDKRTYLREHEAAYLPAVSRLGPRLNFFHRVVGVLALCGVTYVLVSLLGTRDPEKSRLVWTDLGGHAPHALRNLLLMIAASLGLFALLGWGMHADWIAPSPAAWLAAGWTLLMFAPAVLRSAAQKPQAGPLAVLGQDRFWAGVLCAAAVFMHFYFY